MSPDDFTFIAGLLKARSGLVLTPEKSYLLESRLTPLCRRLGLGGVEALIDRLRGDADDALTTEVVAAMTTNDSLFFRDIRPFELLRDDVLPRLMAARDGARSLRIWCAAAALGQEPYSVAMTLMELGDGLDGWNCEIVATDICQAVLARAEAGVYSQFEVQRGMPAELLLKYFDQDGEQWRVRPEVREKVSFRPFNLLDDPAPLGRFDVVLLRNVLIYFDQPTRGEVLSRIARLMADDGMLFLGRAESVLGASDDFEPIPGQRGIYALGGAGARPGSR